MINTSTCSSQDYTKIATRAVSLFCQGNDKGALSFIDKCNFNSEWSIKIGNIFNSYAKDPDTGKPQLGTTTEVELKDRILAVLKGTDTDSAQQSQKQIVINTCSPCSPSYTSTGLLSELTIIIFTDLAVENLENLGKLQQVCKEWYLVANDNTLMTKVFFKIYNKQPPTELTAKEALLRSRTIPIMDKSDLRNKCITFMCNLQWNKQRRFECVTADDSPCFIIEQGFGPNCGKQADEIKKYQLTSNLENYVGPNDIYPELHEFEGTIELGELLITRKFSEHINTVYIFSLAHFNVKIEEVDVGYGNTLAYYSEINNWAKPFKLFYQQQAWTGMIPYSHAFKFVKIDPQGEVTWEEKGGTVTWNNENSNRHWTPRCSGRPHTLPQYFQTYPIFFVDKPKTEDKTALVSQGETSCVMDITGVDVGYGNTLAFFSSSNNWETPIECTCRLGANGSPIWRAEIPYSTFKFVKIGPQGEVTWESAIDRNWQPGNGNCSLSEHFEAFPIEFNQ